MKTRLKVFFFFIFLPLNASGYIDPHTTTIAAKIFFGFITFIFFFGRDLIAARFGLKTKEKFRFSTNYDLIIYSESSSYFNLFQQELKTQRGGRVLYLSTDAREFEKVESCFEFNNIDFFLLRNYSIRWFILSLVSGKKLLTSTPYLGSPQFPRSLRVKSYQYVFHTLMSTHSIYRDHAFLFYDQIECPTSYHMEELKVIQQEKGHFKAELIPANYRLFDRLKKKNWAIDPFLVFICPTRDSQFLNYLPMEIFALKGFKIVFRPHPFERNKYQHLKDQYPHIHIEVTDIEDSKFIEAGILITDWSGIAIEYAYLNSRKFLRVLAPQKSEVNNPTTSFEGLFWEKFGISLKNDQTGIIPNMEILNNSLPMTKEESMEVKTYFWQESEP